MSDVNAKSITSKLLIEELAMRSNLSERESKEVFNIVFQIIGEHLKAFNRVKIINFGSFTSKKDDLVVDPDANFIRVDFNPSSNLKNLDNV